MMFRKLLIASWMIFLMLIIIAFLFPSAAWAPGPSALLAVSVVVILSSCCYGVFIALRVAKSHLRRNGRQ